MSILAAKPANLATRDEMLAQERAEILEGLRAGQKRISPKYFYDQRGSELFDAICTLPEYYPTRTEQAIMERNLPAIAELLGPGSAVIEFGAGSNVKARQLLEHLDSPVAYVPVEISGEYLEEQSRELAQTFPNLSIKPVVADFTKPFDLPEHPTIPNRNLVFFPGSTIGNFSRRKARELLEVMKHEAKPGGALLIGVDLVKSRAVIRAAYNDSRGVTAEFNRNVLYHLNAALGANFRPNNFRHEAVYDEEKRRIEMRLVSTRSHSVDIAGDTIAFEAGEHIITEYSHKYTIEEFVALARAAGLESEAVWTDDRDLFSVHYLTVPEPKGRTAQPNG
jgi:L-histidine N-alpha-methyltransferase